ncbi:FISUMP domain-containing protein [Sporocytophaga myxococcoides]|uniref:FISUMP domain-containing protein n=1 Tax=Sporocytophaga myxococcoides TaxID=153721 RepID=UPI00041B8B52|nr:FISUMP domain-containing protein [Sporocytophaga myxococcoides]
MKTNYVSFKVLAIVFLGLLLSCKKDDKKEVTPQAQFVEINGEQYPIVTIGNQTWTAGNYKGPGGIPYDNLNSRPEYGKYYSFEELQNITIPVGWKIPTTEDFIELAESQGVVFSGQNAIKQDAIKNLVSQTRWLNINGNNKSGFNAYPGGYAISVESPIEGDISEFWTNDTATVSIQESADLKNHNIRIYEYLENDASRFNIRFIKKNK